MKNIKRLINFIFIAICTLYCTAQTDTMKISGETVIKTAVRYIGVPYKWGYSNPKSGFDCSGFTSFLYNQYGYKLHRSAKKQYQQGITVTNENLQKGDLIFFTGRNHKNRTVGHVGIVIDKKSDGSFDFIHSSSRGVGIDNSKTAYYKKRYIGAKRIIL